MVLESLRGRENVISKAHILVYILINKFSWQDFPSPDNYFSPFGSEIKVSGQRRSQNLLDQLLTTFGLLYSSLLGNFCNFETAGKRNAAQLVQCLHILRARETSEDKFS